MKKKELKCRKKIFMLMIIGIIGFSGCATSTEAGKTDTQAASGPIKPVVNAEEVKGFEFPTDTVIVQSEMISGEIYKQGNTEYELPEYCKVGGEINRRTGSSPAGPKDYFIGFELRLPTEWNGKFFFQGGGGTDGVINPPLGDRHTGTVPALMRGYAVVSTDAGHQGGDCQFGYDQQARVDYGYNAVFETAITAKSIIENYYGRPSAYSYFMGGSNGGRQGFAFVQKFPTIFDGVIAGAPGFNLTKASIAEMWANQLMADIAPKDENGSPILYQALNNEDVNAVAQTLIEAYDGLDGLEDGLIFDIEAARGFDLSKAGTSIAPEKIEALEKLFAGPVNSQGEELYISWPWDTGINSFGWRLWILGTDSIPALNVVIGSDSTPNVFMTPPSDNFNPADMLGWSLGYDFDRDPPQSVLSEAIINNTNPYIDAFRDAGGKLIIYHGMSDSVFSAYDTIDYYENVIEAMGGLEETQEFARLFLFPGMAHVSGGPSTDQFDALTALENWVEKGVAPDEIIATGTPGGPYEDVSRPYFPYPATTEYNGEGDPNSADSFHAKYPE